MKRALVTGGAGFIGSHLVDSLLADGWSVVAFDNFDPFYDRRIKLRNIATHRISSGYTLIEGDLRSESDVRRCFAEPIDVVVHLAARAGVRPSIHDPAAYQAVNVAGTQTLLEAARQARVAQFVFASSSSVYGVNPRVPWSEEDHVLRPISPYASTKISGELLGSVYSHLYGIRFLALRFFTVYGPRQRPDLAIYKFASDILNGRPVTLYGDGTSRRDYTYVDDIVRGIRAAIEYTGTSYQVINLGNSQTVTLLEMVSGVERALGMRAKLQHVADQPGDVPQTWASIEKAQRLLGYAPTTPYSEGIRKFAEWMGAAELASPA